MDMENNKVGIPNGKLHVWILKQIDFDAYNEPDSQKVSHEIVFESRRAAAKWVRVLGGNRYLGCDDQFYPKYILKEKEILTEEEVRELVAMHNRQENR